MAGRSVLTKSTHTYAEPLKLTDHDRQLDPATQRTCQEQEGMSIPFVYVGKKTVIMEKSCRRHGISIFLNSEPEPEAWTRTRSRAPEEPDLDIAGIYTLAHLIWPAGLLAPV